MSDLLSRDEFQKELEALAERLPTVALRQLMKSPWEAWAPHLRADACKRLGLEPVQAFRRLPGGSAGSPE